MSFTNKIKDELCSHMENNFKFDMGEMFALAKINRDYINKRFELLSKKKFESYA